MFITNEELQDANLLIDYYLYQDLNFDTDKKKKQLPNYYYWTNLMRAIQGITKKGFRFVCETLPDGNNIAMITDSYYTILGECKSKNLQFAIYFALLNFVSEVIKE